MSLTAMAASAIRSRRAAVALSMSISVMAFTVAPAPAVGATTFVVNRTGDAADNNLADARCDTSAASGKQCTLRAAIQEANDTPGTDTINFNITSASKVIAPASPLPPITSQVTINGYSQPGSSVNTKATGDNAVIRIVLDGLNAGTDANGLELQASNSTIRGLDIQRFSGSGILVASANNIILGNFIGTNAAGTAARGNTEGVTVNAEGNFIGSGAAADRNLISANVRAGVLITGDSAHGNRVLGNYIGTTKSGASPLANASVGVEVQDAPNNTVGGTSPGAGNVISANGGPGILISGHSESNGSVVQGNLIGLDASGSAALGNHLQGISIGASDVTIGGTTASARNVVSGNGSGGVALFGLFSHDVVVQGNYIGTNAAGNAAVGNTGIGVDIDHSPNNTIGGSAAGAGNVISGNTGHGIQILGSLASGNTVQGNSIGTKADGTGALGNGLDGVGFFSATNNTLGGPGAASNLISRNGGTGVFLDSASTGNQILGNVVRLSEGQGIRVAGGPNTIGPGNIVFSNFDTGVAVQSTAAGVRITANQIFGNQQLGIDLVGGTDDGFGTTANDTDDPDTGANNLQNFPVLTTATRSNANGITTVTGTLNSNPSTDFKIELFLANADASNHGEAQVLLATKTFTTDSGGDRSFSIAVGSLSAGMVLTATATSVVAGNTSEFSLNRTVVPGP